MFSGLFDSNERQLKKLRPLVAEVNALEEKFKELKPSDIKDKTKKWQKDLESLSTEEQANYLDKVLVEAFALVREATRRVQKIRLHDVQIMAGIALHQGKITEQKTGEGKTNTATLSLYLNSLPGRGVHLVTPNDYLSRHGAGWMGSVYGMLGISVGVIMQERAFVFDPEYEGKEFHDAYAVHLKEVSRQEAYKSDVIYGTNHEFGFDYLRDNMTRSLDQMVQTNPVGDWGFHNFAIVDEVDSILIDVARTPLIISTKDSKPTDRYHDADRIIKALAKGSDYEVEEKFKNATLTDLGVRRVERLLDVENLYEQDFEMVHLIEQALIAHALYERDKDYVVKGGEVVIVDQFTGRLLPSNRFSHGLHQAIEAKEQVDIKEESKTLAEISYQNYFRMYRKLAGMTGTAATEAEEFYKIYKLDVIVVPTNTPISRDDRNDIVYKSEAGKFKAVADEIEQNHKEGRPVLVGTTSVEKSQLLHQYLKRKKVPHEILNAKNHEKEALIIAQAGKEGSVTISTNMAGRGVDIILGGDPPEEGSYEGVKSSGGLHVIGTERHESRRIDNQLRGRAGRQGDPGSSRFFVSLQDDLMRVFGGAQVEGLMDRFGLDDNTPLEASMVSKAIENAQKKVEGFNFDRRKQLVEMDDIMNVHREVVYGLRRKILEISHKEGRSEKWLVDKLADTVGFDSKVWESNKKDFGEEEWVRVVKELSLPVVDLLWMDHLVDMDQVREGIGLRGYAQRDPMVEYKKEGRERFEILVNKLYSSISERISKVTEQVAKQKEEYMSNLLKHAQYSRGAIETGVSEEAAAAEKAGGAGSGGGGGGAVSSGAVSDSISSGRTIKVEAVKSGEKKVGRNDPCSCGSGKKYKNCHGKN